MFRDFFVLFNWVDGTAIPFSCQASKHKFWRGEKIIHCFIIAMQIFIAVEPNLYFMNFMPTVHVENVFFTDFVFLIDTFWKIWANVDFVYWKVSQVKTRKCREVTSSLLSEMLPDLEIHYGGKEVLAVPGFPSAKHFGCVHVWTLWRRRSSCIEKKFTWCRCDGFCNMLVFICSLTAVSRPKWIRSVHCTTKRFGLDHFLITVDLIATISQAINPK